MTEFTRGRDTEERERIRESKRERKKRELGKSLLLKGNVPRKTPGDRAQVKVFCFLDLLLLWGER